MAKYWENETPVTITTVKNVLRYYQEAGKLSVARPSWTDDKGTERQGKTVALDVAALLESGGDTLSAAREVFADIVRSIDERIDLMGGAR